MKIVRTIACGNYRCFTGMAFACFLSHKHYEFSHKTDYSPDKSFREMLRGNLCWLSFIRKLRYMYDRRGWSIIYAIYPINHLHLVHLTIKRLGYSISIKISLDVHIWQLTLHGLSEDHCGLWFYDV